MEGFEVAGGWNLGTVLVGQWADKLKPGNEFLIRAVRAGPHDPAWFGALAQEKFHNLARLDLAG